MRNTRVEKFKRHRRKKTVKLLVFALLLPMASIFLGYLITALVILPVMTK